LLKRGEGKIEALTLSIAWAAYITHVHLELRPKSGGFANTSKVRSSAICFKSCPLRHCLLDLLANIYKERKSGERRKLKRGWHTAHEGKPGIVSVVSVLFCATTTLYDPRKASPVAMTGRRWGSCMLKRRLNKIQ
jgi:hypothetical protein